MADEEKAPEKPAEAEAKPAKSPKPAKDAKDAKPAGKGGPLPKILLIAGGLIAVTGVSLAVIFMVLVPRLKSAQTSEQKPKVEQAAMGPVFEVKDLVINSADIDELHYFKVGVAFEMVDASLMEEMKQRDPAIRDLLISELSQHTVQDLNSQAGREKLRQVLLDKLKARVGKEAFKSLYFTEYVAQ